MTSCMKLEQQTGGDGKDGLNLSSIGELKAERLSFWMESINWLAITRVGDFFVVEDKRDMKLRR